MSFALCVLAVICFILGLFSVPRPTVFMISLGLALYVGSRLIPPGVK